MIGCFFRVRSILVRVAQNIGGTGDHFHFDFLHVVRVNIVLLNRFHHGGQRRMAECLDRETLHAAIKNAVVRLA